MNPPTRVAAPERRTPPRPARPAPAPYERGFVVHRGVAERDRLWRRALFLGMVGAVLLHLLVLRISPLFIRFAELVEGIGYVVPPPPPAEGMKVVMLRAREREREPTPRIRTEERQPQPPPAVEPGTSAPASELAPARRPAEFLRPRVGDWRLIVPPLALRERALTPAERTALMNERLRDRLATVNDSAAAAARREAAALDWTVGEEGNRWGISPAGIHLGGLTLPLPFNVGPDPATAREQAERAQQFSEIQRQAGQAGIDETFEERVKAIRQRRDAERKKKEDKAAADTVQKKPS